MPFVAIVYAADANEAAIIRERYSQPDAGRLVAMYHFPKPDAPGCTGSCRAGTGWKRHANGHMIHACGKRNVAWRVHVARALFDFFGRNLVRRPPTVFQNPEGW